MHAHVIGAEASLPEGVQLAGRVRGTLKREEEGSGVGGGAWELRIDGWKLLVAAMVP